MFTNKGHRQKKTMRGREETGNTNGEKRENLNLAHDRFAAKLGIYKIVLLSETVTTL